jgi:hypothetical protein
MYGLAKTTESFYSELWRVGKIFMLNSLRPLQAHLHSFRLQNELFSAGT